MSQCFYVQSTEDVVVVADQNNGTRPLHQKEHLLPTLITERDSDTSAVFTYATAALKLRQR